MKYFGGKNKQKGNGNTTLTDRINYLPYANKISEDCQDRKCFDRETSSECEERIVKDCCKKINIHQCEFDNTYPIFIYVPGIGCEFLNKTNQEESANMYLDLLNHPLKTFFLNPIIEQLEELLKKHMTIYTSISAEIYELYKNLNEIQQEGKEKLQVYSLLMKWMLDYSSNRKINNLFNLKLEKREILELSELVASLDRKFWEYQGLNEATNYLDKMKDCIEQIKMSDDYEKEKFSPIVQDLEKVIIESEINLQQIRRNIRRVKEKYDNREMGDFFPKKNFLYLCHKTKVALQTIKDISLNKCQKTIFSRSNFLQDFSLFIQEKISQNYTIYLYGESFGGSICNSISERVYGEKLFIRTFGSIYISDKSLIPRNIDNYMFYGDVAWNKLSKNCSNSEKNIIKIDIEGVINNKFFRRNKILYDRWEDSVDNPNNVYHNYYILTGTSDEWFLHSAYYNYIKNSINKDITDFFKKSAATVIASMARMFLAVRRMKHFQKKRLEDKVKQKEREEGGETPVLGSMTPKAFTRTPSAASLSSGAGLSSPSTPKISDGKPEKRRKKKKGTPLLQEEGAVKKSGGKKNIRKKKCNTKKKRKNNLKITHRGIHL
jgi:hypothetical protein